MCTKECKSQQNNIYNNYLLFLVLAIKVLHYNNFMQKYTRVCLSYDDGVCCRSVSFDKFSDIVFCTWNLLHGWWYVK